MTKRNATSSCYGQQFDFSDHIVLFFAQSFPILIFEATVHHYSTLWPSNTSNGIELTTQRGAESILIYILNTVMASCLSLLFLYLNIITLLAAHSTTSYFHTVTECILGYVITLVVQIPLALLIWCTRWPRLRNFLGLPFSNLLMAREHSD